MDGLPAAQYLTVVGNAIEYCRQKRLGVRGRGMNDRLQLVV